MMKILAARALIDARRVRCRGAAGWPCHGARGQADAEPALALVLSTHVALLAWLG